MRIHRRRRRGCGKAGNSLTVFRFSINLPLTIQTVAERASRIRRAAVARQTNSGGEPKSLPRAKPRAPAFLSSRSKFGEECRWLYVDTAWATPTVNNERVPYLES
jgi:hypothetical protein